MIILHQNQNHNDNSNNIESQNKDNGEKNYENILKNNPTYKKTYDNTGYLFMGDIGYDVSKVKQSNIDACFSRYKQKHILVPQEQAFTININDIELFLAQIKANYKINNIHWVLGIHGSQDQNQPAAMKFCKYSMLNDYSVMLDVPRNLIEELLKKIYTVFKNDDIYIYNISTML